jgi:hypothetical protein
MAARLFSLLLSPVKETEKKGKSKSKYVSRNMKNVNNIIREVGNN